MNQNTAFAKWTEMDWTQLSVGSLWCNATKLAFNFSSVQFSSAHSCCSVHAMSVSNGGGWSAALIRQQRCRRGRAAEAPRAEPGTVRSDSPG